MADESIFAYKLKMPIVMYILMINALCKNH